MPIFHIVPQTSQIKINNKLVIYLTEQHLTKATIVELYKSSLTAGTDMTVIEFFNNLTKFLELLLKKYAYKKISQLFLRVKSKKCYPSIKLLKLSKAD